MPKATLRLTEEFQYGLAAIHSERLLGRIRTILEGLQEFPDIGSHDVAPCLRKRFGPSIRTLPVSTFVLVFRHTGEYVDVLALVAGPTIR